MSTRRDFLRGVCLAAPGNLLAGQPGAASRAAAFLKTRQSGDGAWRSTLHGSFRDGTALTPLVLLAMPDAKGLAWLAKLTDQLALAAEPWRRLTYPLFTASMAAQVFANARDPKRASVWAALIQRLQLSPALGWPVNDPRCHGWGDSPLPPAFDASTLQVADMQNPNLSATAYALAGLRAAGMPGDASFVLRCQNRDGGFFFALDDPVRNKAGASRSYATATCDGILSLLHAGIPRNDPRLLAAFRWLQKHPQPPPPSLLFYHASVLAQCLSTAFSMNALLPKQRADGSWANEVPHAMEDDPILATALALRALRA
jgi:Prenyltransferase and squalene oxidase repeat